MAGVIERAKPVRTARSPDADRWRAVLERDGAADFVFAVRTTGIYCRPSCAARRAKRENVTFFDTTRAAEAAGFRACKRCNPRAASKAESDAVLIADACRMIEAAETPPALTQLAAAAHLSPHHFHRLFKAVTGVTPKGYADALRRVRVQGELRAARSVTAAVLDAGYNSSARFYETSQGALGMSTKAFRAGGAGMKLDYAIAPCALGFVLVAASDKGVAAILLGDDGAMLEQELAGRFPQAELIGAGQPFARCLAEVVSAIDDPARGLSLPLDIRGTAFQQRVWAALRNIPAGETASYSEIARAMGKPDAVRAVAGACAANPLAVAIPCHRVVRSDGALSGYRWGIERKRALLAREKKQR